MVLRTVVLYLADGSAGDGIARLEHPTLVNDGREHAVRVDFVAPLRHAALSVDGTVVEIRAARTIRTPPTYSLRIGGVDEQGGTMQIVVSDLQIFN